MIKALRILNQKGRSYNVGLYNVKSIYTSKDKNDGRGYYTVEFEDGSKHIIKNATTIAEY